MLNTNYDYSCIYLNLPLNLSEKIIQWGVKNVKDRDIYVSQSEPSFGREDNIHISLLYGIHNSCFKESLNLVKGFGEIKASLGKIDIFTGSKNIYDVVVIKVISEDLYYLNKILSENIIHTNKYGDYKPHITISYVKKNKGWKFLGNKNFEDIKFNSDLCTFSSKNGNKYNFFIN
jgi:hypothetical protein